MGRPAKNPGDVKSTTLKIRVTSEQIVAYDTARKDFYPHDEIDQTNFLRMMIADGIQYQKMMRNISASAIKRNSELGELNARAANS